MEKKKKHMKFLFTNTWWSPKIWDHNLGSFKCEYEVGKCYFGILQGHVTR